MAEAKLDDLGKRFPDASVNELRRFLVARSEDVDAAAAMYQAHLDWKAKLPADLHQEALHELKKGKVVIRGRDSQGRPVLIWRTRFNDPTVRDLQQTVLSLVYMAMEVSKLADAQSPDGKIVVVVDRHDGIPDLELVKAVAAIMNANFPERLHCALVVPVNMVFRGLWSTIKWFFDPKTRGKVIMMGSKEQLKQYVDTKQLPVSLGGEDGWEFNPDEA
jgi:hypothetical protein